MAPSSQPQRLSSQRSPAPLLHDRSDVAGGDGQMHGSGTQVSTPSLGKAQSSLSPAT